MYTLLEMFSVCLAKLKINIHVFVPNFRGSRIRVLNRIDTVSKTCT